MGTILANGRLGRQFAPRAFLTAPMWDWSVVYRDVVQRVHDGQWESTDYWNGLESGVVELAPLSDLVPADVKALVARETANISSGDRVVFAGPWNKQDGSVAYGEGQIPTDGELLAMDYFAQGVVGTIPK